MSSPEAADVREQRDGVTKYLLIDWDRPFMGLSDVKQGNRNQSWIALVHCSRLEKVFDHNGGDRPHCGY